MAKEQLRDGEGNLEGPQGPFQHGPLFLDEFLGLGDDIVD